MILGIGFVSGLFRLYARMEARLMANVTVHARAADCSMSFLPFLMPIDLHVTLLCLSELLLLRRVLHCP